MTLKFLDKVTGYKVISFITRVIINGGADLGKMNFVWNIWSVGYLWNILVEMSEGYLSYGPEVKGNTYGGLRRDSEVIGCSKHLFVCSGNPSPFLATLNFRNGT